MQCARYIYSLVFYIVIRSQLNMNSLENLRKEKHSLHKYYKESSSLLGALQNRDIATIRRDHSNLLLYILKERQPDSVKELPTNKNHKLSDYNKDALIRIFLANPETAIDFTADEAVKYMLTIRDINEQIDKILAPVVKEKEEQKSREKSEKEKIIRYMQEWKRLALTYLFCREYIQLMKLIEWIKLCNEEDKKEFMKNVYGKWTKLKSLFQSYINENVFPKSLAKIKQEVIFPFVDLRELWANRTDCIGSENGRCWFFKRWHI